MAGLEKFDRNEAWKEFMKNGSVSVHFLMKAVSIGSVISFFLLSASCSEVDSSTSFKAAPVRNVEVLEIGSEIYQWHSTYPTILRAKKNIDIKSRIDGFIVDRHFVEGQYVAKGDLLYSLDLSLVKAKLSKAKEDLKKHQLLADKKLRQLERASVLGVQDFISKSQLEILEFELREVQLDIERARSEIKLLQVEMDFAQIKSPISGRVGKARLKVGDYVKTADAVLTHVIDDSEIYAEIQVPQKYKSFFNSKEKIRSVTVQTLDESDSYEGSIEYIDIGFNSATNTNEVRIVVNNLDKGLSPGEYATATVQFSSDIPQIIIPNSAVHFTQGIASVYIVENNILFEKVVETQALDHKRQKVTSGLKELDLLVIENLSNLEAGVRVNPIIQSADIVTASVTSPSSER